jgi:hypothetical protein
MQNRVQQRTISAQRLLAVLCLAIASSGVLPARPANAGTTDLPGPPGSVAFGTGVYALPNGNIVVTDPQYGIAGTGSYIGAVYLYDGGTHALISSMTGSQEFDMAGSGGVTILNDGNYVVQSLSWANDTAAEAGAATWCSAVTGCPATVSAQNSLAGSHAADNVGGKIQPLAGGAYLVISTNWNNARGAITYCSSGVACADRVVSVDNSLVGGTGADPLDGAKPGDMVGFAVKVLPDGSYLSLSPYWALHAELGAANGAVAGCPATGCTGVVSTTNSLYGETVGDSVGLEATVFPDSSFVIQSYKWHDHNKTVGAVTFCASVSDARCFGQPVSTTNSLTGYLDGQRVGDSKVITLTDGGYAVGSTYWVKAIGTTQVGAVTYCSVAGGASSCTGKVVSETNSLVGTQTRDAVGTDLIALPNGGFVVRSPNWSSYRGAVTFCNSGPACMGTSVSAANSLVGTSTGVDINGGDQIGSTSVVRMNDGGYLVSSPFWDNGAVDKAGAVTYCPSTGCVGTVVTTTSLVGTHARDQVGFGNSIVFANGSYVALSSLWSSSVGAKTYAATFCSSGTACAGQAVTTANSLVGSRAGDTSNLNYLQAYPLSNGGYLVGTWNWSNGSANGAGAVTFCPAGGCVGIVSATNSLIGTHTNDGIGYDAREVADELYVVPVSTWVSDTVAEVGAIALCSIDTGCLGPMTPANSAIGTAGGDGPAMSFTYDAVHHNLVIGWQTQNKLTFFSIPMPKKGTRVDLASSAPGGQATYGDSLTFTATLTATSGTAVPTGQVTFMDDQAVLCADVPLADGSAPCSSTALQAGGHLTITAHYTSTANFSASVSSAYSLEVQPAVLTATARHATRAYGEANPTFEAALEGYVNGETPASSGVTGDATCTSLATVSSTVSGSPYPIDCITGTLTATNYSFAFVSGLLTVTQAPLTVTAVDAMRLYGDADPVFSTTLKGFKNGETLGTSGVTGQASCGSAATLTSPVTDTAYCVACEKGTLSAANYAFTFESGLLTITQATLTATANNTSRRYAEQEPSFGASFAGFKNGEVLETSGVTGTPACTTTANISSTVVGGPYPITCAQGSLVALNYDFAFESGILTVTRATAAITVGNLNQTYDGLSKTVSVTTTPAGLTTVVSYSGTKGTDYVPAAAPPIGPGNYVVTATIQDDNYEPASVSSPLIIWKRLMLLLVYR